MVDEKYRLLDGGERRDVDRVRPEVTDAVRATPVTFGFSFVVPGRNDATAAETADALVPTTALEFAPTDYGLEFGS